MTGVGVHGRRGWPGRPRWHGLRRLDGLCEAAGLLFLLAACASSAPAPQPGHGVMTLGWVGHDQADLLAARGEPQTVRVRPDGSLLLEYRAERGGLTCRSVYLSDPLGRIAAEQERCE